MKTTSRRPDGPLPQSCKEAHDALVSDTDADETLAARVRAHRLRCERCLAERVALEKLKSDVKASDASLDDLTRARMHAKLALRFDELATRSAQPRSLSGRVAAVGVVALPLLAAAALLIFLWPLPRKVDRMGVPGQPGTAEALASAQPVLRPHHVQGLSARAAEAIGSGRPVNHLMVPAHGRVRASLSDKAELTVVGPADLSVVSVARDLIEVQLQYGLLLGDYDHAAGGTLRIHTPGGVADVVGTLFAVEVDGGRTRVSVSHGAVEVRGRFTKDRQLVSDGRQWNSLSDGLHALPKDVAALMSDHEQGARSARGEEQAPAPSVATLPQPALVPPSSRVPGYAQRSRADLPASAPPTVPPALVQEPGLEPPAAALTPSIAAESGGVGAVASGSHHERYVPTSRSQPAAARALAGAEKDPAASPSMAHIDEPAAAPAPQAAPTPPPQNDTPEQLYASAEQAMASGNMTGAAASLEALLQKHPNHRLADTARYELLLRALSQGNRAEGQRRATDLVRHGRDAMLVESARFAECRLIMEAQEASKAATCLNAFRAEYPRSARDADALAQLMQLARKAEGCPAARGRAQEYLRRYSSAQHAAQARDILQTCKQESP